MCNHTFFFYGYFSSSAAKQAISIKFATTVRHFYVTMTLQTCIYDLPLLFFLFFSVEKSESVHRVQHTQSWSRTNSCVGRDCCCCVLVVEFFCLFFSSFPCFCLFCFCFCFFLVFHSVVRFPLSLFPN